MGEPARRAAAQRKPDERPAGRARLVAAGRLALASCQQFQHRMPPLAPSGEANPGSHWAGAITIIRPRALRLMTPAVKMLSAPRIMPRHAPAVAGWQAGQA
jgi:hypothetical protein